MQEKKKADESTLEESLNNCFLCDGKEKECRNYTELSKLRNKCIYRNVADHDIIKWVENKPITLGRMFLNYQEIVSHNELRNAYERIYNEEGFV